MSELIAPCIVVTEVTIAPRQQRRYSERLVFLDDVIDVASSDLDTALERVGKSDTNIVLGSGDVVRCVEYVRTIRALMLGALSEWPYREVARGES